MLSVSVYFTCKLDASEFRLENTLLNTKQSSSAGNAVSSVVCLMKLSKMQEHAMI
jgi:hypothetical protein